MIDVKEAFDRHEDEFLKFDRVLNPLHSRPDMCALLLLDKLVPFPGRDMIAAAEHDEIWLDTDLVALSGSASDDDILMLVRCGVRYDDDVDSLAMYA